jgi:hypothetical protein
MSWIQDVSRQLVLVAIVASLAVMPVAVAAGNSAATITASFADSCRVFFAHSSKDISHVEFHYADGRVVKDESITKPDYAFRGGAGDGLSFVIVKSGTTSQQFDCVQINRAPTARLEIKTPTVDQSLLHCFDFFAGGLGCEQSSARTDWTATTRIPNNGGDESGIFHWGCGAFSDSSQCSMTMSFRGTRSSDPDGDIVSWSLDFADGASVSGSWSAAPPAEVTHEYVSSATNGFGCSGVFNGIAGVCRITLTVTDSSGQSHSDTLVMTRVDQTPD